MKALSGPFAEMSFLPTGGVGFGNAREYIDLPNVFAVGGSFPVPSQAQRQGDWKAVADACAQARQVVQG